MRIRTYKKLVTIRPASQATDIYINPWDQTDYSEEIASDYPTVTYRSML